MKKSIKKGFTLVELLVVIAIIAILSIVGIVGYVSFTNRARVSNDTTIVTELNRVLQAEHVNKKPSTMQDVVDEIFDAGFDLTKLTPTAAKHHIVYDFEGDRFYLLNESYEIVGGEKNGQALTGNKWDHWKVIQSYAEASDAKFSHYLGRMNPVNTAAILNVTTGIDVGSNTVAQINYTGGSVGKEVVIRTNSANTTLTINAKDDTVNHYGVVGKVDAQKIDMECYNEYGSASYIKVTEGKVVAKDGSKIDVVFANNTDSSKVAVAKESTGKIEKGLTTVQVVSNDNYTNYEVLLEYSADGVNAYSAEDIESIGELSVASDTGVQPQGMDYTAIVNYVGYDSLYEAILAANPGDTVSLLKDNTDNTSKGTTAYCSLNPSNLSAAIILEKSISINGFNHTFRTNCKSGIAINASNISVSLKDIIIETTITYSSAIYIGQDIANVNLNVEGSKLKAPSTSYTVRSGNGSNHLSLNFKDTTIEGWSAFTIRSSHSTINLTDCDLWGENDAAPHPSNGYATIVFDGADYSTSGYDSTSPYDGNPGQCGSNNVMTIVNTKVGATSLTSNGQQWLSLQYGPRGNSIIVDSSSILSYATSINCTSEAESSSNTVKVGNNTIIPSN